MVTSTAASSCPGIWSPTPLSPSCQPKLECSSACSLVEEPSCRVKEEQQCQVVYQTSCSNTVCKTGNYATQNSTFVIIGFQEINLSVRR